MQFSKSFIRTLADPKDPSSFANKLRAKRFREFEKWTGAMPRPLRILDVGGTNIYWEIRGWAGRTDIHIVALNDVAEVQRHENVQPVFASDLSNLKRFDDGSFDLVFSNSVIEHLYSFENQRRMAAEIQRVGKCFWIQSPNFWFPIEPHFYVPGWQWMPVELRVAALRRWRVGCKGPFADTTHARDAVTEVQLLTKRQLKTLFPEATLRPERFCGLVKSWNVVKGL